MVKASITGSIIGNVLLVLGLSILFGGTKYKEQRFNRTAARTSVISLSLAAIGLIIPTVFHLAADSSPGGWSPLVEQKLSLAIAVVLFLTYFCMLVSRSGPTRISSKVLRNMSKKEAGNGRAARPLLFAHLYRHGRTALGVSCRHDRKRPGLRRPDRGVCRCDRGGDRGNAAEHSTAILMAMKNKMDLSVGIAIGSSLQIALFVAPVLIFLSYLFGRPMNLEFTMPEVVAVVASVYILFQISGDGETNWIEGIQLLSVYVILGILFFYLPEPQQTAP